MAEKSTINVERTDSRLTISMIRPPMNRLTEEMIHEITQVVEKERGNDDLKLVIFRSDLPEVFSDGMEIQERKAERIGGYMAAFGHLLYVLNELEAISVAEVDGICHSGALELATYCDMIIASDRSNLGHPGIKAGVFSPVAAAVYPHLLGRNRALELLITARELSAKEACDMGLINRVWDTVEFSAKAREFYAGIEQFSALSLRLTKKAVEQALYERVPVAIRRAEDIFLNELLRSHDAQEGLRAVIENRKPKWQNR